MRHTFLASLALIVLCPAVRSDDLDITLTFLDRVNIKDEDAGLKEPSGLVLSRRGRALWTVSDDKKKIFQIDLDGDVDDGDSFDIDANGCEGITLDGEGKFLYVVSEDTNAIVKIDRHQEEIVLTKPLSDIAGFDQIRQHFPANSNNGLEGITIRNSDGALFILKELPGLLIELTPQLDRIRETTHLNKESGFSDNDVAEDEIDFSGVCFDAKRDCFWIVSDRAKRVYLFKSGRVKQSIALGYQEDGEFKEVDKAEGVTVDTERDLIYIASDSKADVYRFKIH